MRRENEEVDVEEVAAVKPWSERRRGRGWRCFEALSFVEDVSYPRERALVNRRGRLGVAPATPQPHSPNCRLARLSVLYLNTWRICSLGRRLLPLYAGERKREREHRILFCPRYIPLYFTPSGLHLFRSLFRESLLPFSSLSLSRISVVASSALTATRCRSAPWFSSWLDRGHTIGLEPGNETLYSDKSWYR